MSPFVEKRNDFLVREGSENIDLSDIVHIEHYCNLIKERKVRGMFQIGHISRRIAL